MTIWKLTDNRRFSDEDYEDFPALLDGHEIMDVAGKRRTEYDATAPRGRLAPPVAALRFGGQAPMEDERDPVRELLVDAIMQADGGPTRDDERWEAEGMADDIIGTFAWRELVAEITADAIARNR